MARLGVALFICALALCIAPAASPAADKPKMPAKSKTADKGKPADVHASAGQNAFHDLWIKVAERTCVKCHNADGDASDSEFVLTDLAKVPASERGAAMGKNLDAFTRMAKQKGEGSRTWIVVKATGGKEHGGGEVLKADSTGLRLLEEFVRSVQKKPASGAVATALFDDDRRPFFDGVEMIGDQRLLRRATLSLAARLPTDAERKAVSTGGLKALATVLDAVMREDAFYERLVEGFNDIFLTRGIDDNAETVLSYDHFEHSRLWYQKYKIENVPEKDQQKAMYKLVDQYREAMLREPLELIRHIVKENHPFTEILTANYTMVSPYTARGYGVFEEIKGQFKNPDDPFEFIPTRIKALKGRDGKVQPTADGFYPHSGLLTMFQYLKRYPTTETNRNRLRARMYYQQFLGVDIMNLAPRVSDAAAIGAKYKVPTMEAAECVVCHKTVDPIAGLFQDYYSEDGSYKPRKAGWFADMFGTGREGTDLPEKERWRSLQWLAEMTIKDPRFAIAMTEHVYYILTGRKVLLPPDDIDDPVFASRRRAYRAQRELIERAAERLAKNNFNLKVVFQELAVSPFYRADGLATAEKQPERLAELDDVGLVRMLSPEQLERKIAAIFGKKWGRLEESYAVLYGGIDSKEVTERLTEPSGAIGSIQRILANDVACKRVADDFKRPAAERRFFPGIEIDDVPNTNSPRTEKRIRDAIVHLHQYLLGRDDKPNDPEVTATYKLFAEIVKEATARPQFDKVETYFCKSGAQEGPADLDPNYTLRAWRAVVVYLLRQHDFLYE